ncbi:MAG: hypothetical protein V4611_01825 [Patescibacteria group bacterium]
MSFWLVLGIIAWIIIAFWPARWAQKKGYSFFIFLILSWFISFLLTLLVVAFLRDKTETARDRADDEAVEKILDSETPTPK